MSKTPTFDFSRPILITAALKQEIRPLIKKLAAKRYKPEEVKDLFYVEMKGKQLFFLITGVGKKQVRYRLKKVLKLINIETIISIGMAGAVEKGLVVGDNVLSQKVLLENHKGEYELECNGVKRRFHSIDLDTFEAAGMKIVGKNLTVPDVYRTEEKKALGNHFCLLDMETFYIAKVAKELIAEVKIYSIRSISDDLHSKIPPLNNVTGSTFNKGLMVLLNSLKNPENFYWYPKAYLNCAKSIQSNTEFIFRLISIK